jgi:hypothetical protein
MKRASHTGYERNIQVTGVTPMLRFAQNRNTDVTPYL